MNKKSTDNNIRKIVLDMLVDTLENGAFSHLVLNQTLSDYSLTLQEKTFLERLYHGVLEQVIYLDWIISTYSAAKIQKIKPVVKNILRMSIYQMLFMDAVPDHAAINEAVKLTRVRGYAGLVPYVNGVLRAFQRGGVKEGMPDNVAHAAPLWLYERLTDELGPEVADAFFDAAREPKNEIYARLMLSRAPAEDIIKMLEIDGCEVERVEDMPEAVKLKHVGDLTGLNAYRQGLLFVQDLSSIRVGRTARQLADAQQLADTRQRADAQQTKKILDVCAAPGGKSLHLAELFSDAAVLARDLSPHKVHLIEENIARSELCNIRAEVHDALVFDEGLAGQIDLLLADLPCSGIGVIGRKPDIKLRLKEEDLRSLSALQREILEVTSGYVRSGGILLYSTCTISRSENQDNAAWFTQTHPFEQIYEKQSIPGRDEGDGFYIAAFRRET